MKSLLFFYCYFSLTLLLSSLTNFSNLLYFFFGILFSFFSLSHIIGLVIFGSSSEKIPFYNNFAVDCGKNYFDQNYRHNNTYLEWIQNFSSSKTRVINKIILIVKCSFIHKSINRIDGYRVLRQQQQQQQPRWEHWYKLEQKIICYEVVRKKNKLNSIK